MRAHGESAAVLLARSRARPHLLFLLLPLLTPLTLLRITLRGGPVPRAGRQLPLPSSHSQRRGRQHRSLSHTLTSLPLPHPHIETPAQENEGPRQHPLHSSRAETAWRQQMLQHNYPLMGTRWGGREVRWSGRDSTSLPLPNTQSEPLLPNATTRVVRCTPGRQ